MRLEDLDYFLAVARTGHAGRAADAMGVSQPALTKGIQRLEHELGLPLFERTPKGMVLTMPGKRFLERSTTARLQLDEAIREAGDLHRGATGLVQVGVTPLLADPFFNPACAELVMQRPAARVNVQVNMNDVLLPALCHGDLDMVICALHESTQAMDLQTIELFQDDLYVAARRSHPLFAKATVSLSDLSHYGWMLPGARAVSRQWLQRKFEQLGLPAPTVVVESNTTLSNLASLVGNTNLLTLVSRITLGSDVGRHLEIVPLPTLTWHRKIGLLLRNGAYVSPLAQRLIELLQEHAAGRSAVAT